MFEISQKSLILQDCAPNQYFTFKTVFTVVKTDFTLAFFPTKIIMRLF